MSVVLRDLFNVTLYPPHISLLCDKKKKKRSRTSTFNFSQPQPSKMVHGINSWRLYLKLRLVT